MATRNINIVYRVNKKELDQATAATEKAKKSTQDLKKSIGETENAGTKAFGAIKNAIVGAGLIAVVGSLAKKIFELGVAQEQLNISFTTFLGSADRAKKLIGELTKFSIVTPFTPDQVNKAAKSLLAFGVEAEKIIPTLKMLGDVSAGTGKDLGEMSIIFGQIRSTGRLMGQDLLQLINAGFNPLQVISQKTGISVGELKKAMEEGAVSFEMVEQAFKDATGEGGLFFNLMEKQSASVGGKLSTVQGNVEQMGKAIFEVSSGPISEFADILVRVTGNIDPFVKAVNNMAIGFKLTSQAMIPLLGGIAILDALTDDGTQRSGQSGANAPLSLDQMAAQIFGSRDGKKIYDELVNTINDGKKKVAKAIYAPIESDDFDIGGNPFMTEAFSERQRKLLEESSKETIDLLGFIYDREFDALVSKNEKELAEIEAHENRKKALKKAAFDYGVDLLGQALFASINSNQAETDAINASYEARIAAAGDNSRRQQELRIEQDAQLEASRKRQAQLDKETAIKQMAIQNLLNSIRALGNPPVPNFGAAALALGYGAAQIVIAKSLGFKDGVIDLNGPGTATSDSIPAMLSKGESVMTAKETDSSRGLLEMIRNRKLDDKIFERIQRNQTIVPVFNDGRIVSAIEKSRVNLSREGAILYETRQINENLRIKTRAKIIAR